MDSVSMFLILAIYILSSGILFFAMLPNFQNFDENKQFNKDIEMLSEGEIEAT